MKNKIKFLSVFICIQFVIKTVSSEPFVALEYRNNNTNTIETSNNQFLNDQNFSKNIK